MNLTERILSDAGGWQVFKQARALHAAGKVRDAVWADGFLRGLVREGENEFRSGLKIESASRIENLCTCRDSRVRALICAHSVAVGLEVLKPTVRTVPGSSASSASEALRGGQAQEESATASREAQSNPGASAAWIDAFHKQAGEPAQLSVVVAPNFAQTLERGGASLGVEAVVQGRRVLLSALDAKRGYVCEADDLRLLRALAALPGAAGSVFPGMLLLDAEGLFAVLRALAGHPRVTLGRRVALTVQADPFRPRLLSELLSGGDLRLRVELPSGSALVKGAKSAWMLRGELLQPVCPDLPAAYLGVFEQPVTIPKAALAAFVSREWALLEKSFDCSQVELPRASSGAVDVAQESIPHSERIAVGESAAPVKFLLKLEGSLNFLSASLNVLHGERFTTVTGALRGAAAGVDSPERAALARLNQAGFSAPDSEGRMALRGELAILEFFARELPLLQREWDVEIGERFEHVTRDIQRVEPRLSVVASGENWFDLDVSMEDSGGERYSSVEIQRLLQSGRSHFRRKDGRLAVFDSALVQEFQNVLRDCDPQQRQAGRFRVAHRHAGSLEEFVQERGSHLEAPEHWRRWATSTRHVEALEPVPLGNLEERLRSYQKHGVYWMHFLAGNGLGGILADEMGLGKTLQALAFLRGVEGRSLVVAPSSLLINWQREAERFCPGMRVLVVAGAQRHERLVSDFAQAQLVITSYPLLRRDVDWYRGEEFATVVLDEAQHIKNPESQSAQAAFALRAKRRFVLTGTPLENSVRDVWSLFHFVMPGYLGTRTDFRERYEVPITRDPGGEEHRRMVRRLRPFVLRRTKRAVASELPDKIEQVVWCDLSAAQRETYSKLLELTRREVGKAEGLRNAGQARILMLTALLRLRQACNDLRLLGSGFSQAPEPDAQPRESLPSSAALDSGERPAESGKMEAFAEVLGEAVEGGHRVLVFSQFVKMLDLIEEWLRGRGVDFCRLDGSTRDRVAEVDRFQGGQVPVFLISLKAGGVGLNLTAADTVIHFDPWWNPAVEAQATDRAHRIGQKSVVTAYKFITRGTVEEKILSLQNRKRSLLDALVESEQPLMEGLTMGDLTELLEA